MSEVAAPARVHRADEHKAARIRHLSRRTGDGHGTVLQGLAQNLHRVAVEFRQLVEEQHAVVRNRNLTGCGNLTAAGKSRRAHRMVRRTERTLDNQRFTVGQHPGNGMKHRRLNRLGERQRRQNRRQTLGKHTLAGAGRTDQKHIMLTHSRKLKCTFCQTLSFDIGIIDADIVGKRMCSLTVKYRRFHRHTPRQMVEQFHDIMHRVNGDTFDDRCFRGILCGDKHLRLPGSLCRNAHTEDAAHTAHLTGKRQLTDEAHFGQISLDRQTTACRHDADEHRKIVKRTLFALVGRCQIDRQRTVRENDTGVGTCRTQTFSGFSDRAVRQTDDLKLRNRIDAVDLNGDGKAFNAKQTCAVNGG